MWISPWSCSFCGKTPAIAWETSATSVPVECQCSSPGWSAEKAINSGYKGCRLSPKTRCPAESKCLTVASPIRLAPVTIFFMFGYILMIKYNFLWCSK